GDFGRLALPGGRDGWRYPWKSCHSLPRIDQPLAPGPPAIEERSGRIRRSCFGIVGDVFVFLRAAPTCLVLVCCNSPEVVGPVARVRNRKRYSVGCSGLICALGQSASRFCCWPHHSRRIHGRRSGKRIDPLRTKPPIGASGDVPPIGTTTGRLRPRSAHQSLWLSALCPHVFISFRLVRAEPHW